MNITAWEDAKKAVARKYHHKGLHFESWKDMVQNLYARKEPAEAGRIINERAAEVASQYNARVILSFEQVQKLLIYETC